MEHTITTAVKQRDYREMFAWFSYSVAILFCLGSIVTLLVWWKYPYKTVELVQIEEEGEMVLPLMSKKINQGDPISFYVEGYRYTEARTVIEKTLYCNSGWYRIYDQGINVRQGVIEKSIAQSTRVPEYLQDGDKCRLIIRNEYWVNPLFPRYEWWMTEWFEVI